MNSLNAHDLVRGPAKARIGSDRIYCNYRGMDHQGNLSSFPRCETFVENGRNREARNG